MQDSIDEAIRTAEYMYSIWEEEYDVHGPKGTKQSNMNLRDLAWLTRRIAKLKKLRKTVDDTVSMIRQEIRSYHS